MPVVGRLAALPSAYPAATAIAAAALLFCWPAFYNGFPLVYGDTASYLDTIDPRKTMWARQIFYTASLRLMHWYVSLWPAILVQGLLTAHLLYLVVRAMQPSFQPGIYIFIAAILALTTSLPWHTSALLPDCFTAILVLGMLLLAFCRDRLHRFEVIYLVALVALAALIHLSHIPLAIGLIAVVFVLRLVFRIRDGRGARTLLLIAAPVFVAAATHLGINTVVHSSFSLSPASSIWLLARFIADGPAKDYLRDECPQRAFILCAYLDELPDDSDEFLWGNYTPNSLFNRAGGYPALRDEAGEIVAGTIDRYPGRLFGAFVRNSARQFVDVGTGHWLLFGENMLDQPISEYIKTQFPHEYADYASSLQLAGALPIDALAAWHASFVVIGALACALLLLRARSTSRRFVLLVLTVLAALVGNAMVTGGISAVHDRYQTRVVWLIVFLACVGALAYVRTLVPTRRRSLPT